jgi:hypothetical protein
MVQERDRESEIGDAAALRRYLVWHLGKLAEIISNY